MERTQQKTASVLLFITRKPGTTFEQFKSYYENHHAHMGVRLFSQGTHVPLSYTRHYVERDSPDTNPSFPAGGADSWDYDCITEIMFENRQQRDEVFGEFTKHSEEVGEDEEKFMDRSKLKILFVAESPSDVRK